MAVSMPRVLVVITWLSLLSVRAAAQSAETDDPYFYNLRTALFPAAFRAGVSQSHFGSAARAELDLARRVGVQVSGDGGWLNVTGPTGPITFSLRAGLIFHIIDEERTTPLLGTVYPEDTPAAGSRGPGTDTDLDVPVQSKLGGPPLRFPDQDRTLSARLRNVHSLRVGYDFARAVERGRPDASDGSKREFLNRMHALYLGYGWGSHWNLGAVAAGGSPQVGWRRFYVDALVTLPTLVASTRIGAGPNEEASFFAVGARIGMEGAIGALLRSAPGIGFGYSLELGALPGRSGVEGYLVVGLGLALDFGTRTRSRSR
jgi:hypothetical protein